ncbi:MAG: hypothetical protein U0401_10355 [Anaerolineae bacterium]
MAGLVVVEVKAVFVKRKQHHFIIGLLTTSTRLVQLVL